MGGGPLPHRRELWLAARSDASAVEPLFNKAIATARRQKAKSIELRVAMSLAKLWQQQGKRADAQQLLADTYNWFTEGFETADLEAARKLLNDLSSDRANSTQLLSHRNEL